MLEENEFSKDLDATYARNTKPVTVTLTAIEVFAIVSAVQISEVATPESSSLRQCAKEAAKKMQDCLDPDSLLFQHLNKGWQSEGNKPLIQNDDSVSTTTSFTKGFIEGFTDYG